MISLIKAILFNTEDTLLFGTPGDFAFSWEDMIKKLSCSSASWFVEMVRTVNGRGENIPVSSDQGHVCSLNTEQTV